jgi:hypothetical protein
LISFKSKLTKDDAGVTVDGVVVIVDDESDESALDSINNTNDLKHGDPNKPHDFLFIATDKS